MAENISELAAKILELCGGASNISSATNCMTRLRLKVVDGNLVKKSELAHVMGVLGLLGDETQIQIVLGPGKVKKVADEFNALLDSESKINKEAIKAKKREEFNKLSGNGFVKFFKRIGLWFKRVQWRKGFRHIGNCFSSLIPGFIFFGICYSISVIINVCLTPDLSKGLIDIVKNINTLPTAGVVFFFIFRCIALGFMDFLAVFVGINAAKEFNVTPVLGGAIGGLSICPQLCNIAIKLGMFTDIVDNQYMNLFIKAGNGGVLAVILSVFLLGYLERFIRRHMPNVLDTIFTPLLTMVIGGTVFIFAIMPITGVISYGITQGALALSNIPSIAGRAAVGFVLAAVFLPIISLGLHHGLTPLYTDIVRKNQPLVLYPIFAMNDACQVGVAASIYLKARKAKHERLKKNIEGGIIPQILGISEPLIYGMTLPMGFPYIPIALGAGIGGAWINAWGVGFCSFDCSGLMGLPLCLYVNGQVDPGRAMILYGLGWLIAVVSGFILATFIIKPKHLERVAR